MNQTFYAEYYQIENVHWWFLGRWYIFMDLIGRAFDRASGDLRMLDVGCGTGTMLGRLEPLGQAFGVDRAAEAVRFCRSRGRDGVTQGGATTLPFASASFDLVCALDLLEHVGDDAASLRELGRVCRPGGRILITVPAYQFLWGRQDEVSHHVRRYTARDLRVKLEAGGLVAHKLTYFNTILFPFITSVRLGRRLLPGASGEEAVSDFSMTRPGRLNDLLAAVFRAEAPALRYLSLPFGVSILALVERLR